MKCRTVQNRLSEYIDGRLPAGLERPIEEHCASCDACAKELAFLRAYRTRMSSLPRKTSPADFLDKLNSRLDVPEPRRGIVRTLFHPARVKLPIEAAGLLAAAALVFVILLPDEARRPIFNPVRGNASPLWTVEIWKHATLTMSPDRRGRVASLKRHRPSKNPLQPGSMCSSSAHDGPPRPRSP